MSQFSTMTTNERKLQAAAICREIQGPEGTPLTLWINVTAVIVYILHRHKYTHVSACKQTQTRMYTHTHQRRLLGGAIGGQAHCNGWKEIKHMETTFDSGPIISFQPLRWARPPIAQPASSDYNMCFYLRQSHMMSPYHHCYKCDVVRLLSRPLYYSRVPHYQFGFESNTLITGFYFSGGLLHA